MGVRWATWLILGAFSAPAVAGAEDNLTLANLSRGDRVRLRLSSGGKTVRGTVDASGLDELVVRPKDPAQPPQRLSPQQIAKLEVVRGRRSHWREGAAIGFVPGALFMGFMDVALDDCYRDCDRSGVFIYGLAGGVVTGTLGALVGLAIKTDRWVLVQKPSSKLTLALAPTKGGFRADLSFSF